MCFNVPLLPFASFLFIRSLFLSLKFSASLCLSQCFDGVRVGSVYKIENRNEECVKKTTMFSVLCFCTYRHAFFPCLEVSSLRLMGFECLTCYLD